MTLTQFFLEICSFLTLGSLRVSLCSTSHLRNRHCILEVAQLWIP